MLICMEMMGWIICIEGKDCCEKFIFLFEIVIKMILVW